MATSGSSSDWKPPSADHLQSLLPQYEITSLIGRGGMGAVYQGRQLSLDRKVAVKVLSESFTHGEDADELKFAERFRREARAMAKLDHPAIISVFDFGETSEGHLYFVMEFIDGMDVQQYLRQHGGKLPQEHALSITAHVLDALEYAHHHGIVHRDIKPANVMLNSEGRVKIADFGLAKATSGIENLDAPALTMTHLAIGTPDYVAPEALDPYAIPDHRADLYAVGVMLYQMLTGKLPRGQFKMPTEIDPELDARLDAIVSRALKTDPEDRYSASSDFRSDLTPVISSPMSKIDLVEAAAEMEAVEVAARTASLAKTRRNNTTVIVGIGVFCLALAGVIGFFLSSRTTPPIELAALSIPEKESSVIPAASPTNSAATPHPVSPRPAVSPSQKAKQKGKVKPMVEPQVTSPIPTVVGAPSETVPVEPSAAPATPPPAPVVTSEPATTDAAPSPTHTEKLHPEFEKRLSAYLSARNSQLDELSKKYTAALDTKFNQAAGQGNLSLVTAYESERERLVALNRALNETSGELTARVTMRPTMEPLPSDVPEDLSRLRETWTSERAKIHTTLDEALQTSLKFLESELTKGRDLDTARKVLAYRTSLLETPDTTIGDSSGLSVAQNLPVTDASDTAPAVARTSPDAKSGKLHSWGSIDGKNIDLSAAEEFDDFITVKSSTYGIWAALRENGEMVSNLKFLNGKTDVVDFEFVANGAICVDKHGDLAAAGVADANKPRRISRAAQLVEAGRYLFAVTSDGRVEGWAKTDIPEDEREVSRVCENLEKVASISANGNVAYFLHQEGRVQKLSLPGKNSKVSEFAPIYPDLNNITTIGITTPGSELLALESSGKLHFRSRINSELPLPDVFSTGTFSDILVTGDIICARRTEDGIWAGWSPDESNKAITEKIATLGPVISLSPIIPGARSPENSGAIIWIE